MIQCLNYGTQILPEIKYNIIIDSNNLAMVGNDLCS